MYIEQDGGICGSQWGLWVVKQYAGVTGGHLLTASINSIQNASESLGWARLWGSGAVRLLLGMVHCRGEWQRDTEKGVKQGK